MLHCGQDNGETMSEPPHNRRDSDDLRPAYRRRAALLWVVVLVAGIAWYGFAAIEASSVGYAPLARRPFTALDWVVYIVLGGGILFAILKIRRCPRCGHRFGIRTVDVCPSCGGWVK